MGIKEARGRVFWEKMVVKWQESGLSQTAFARAHGVGQTTLNRWARKLTGTRKKPYRPRVRSSKKFVDVTSMQLATVTSPSVAVRVVVGEVTMELGELPPVEYVVALGRAAC